MEKAFNQKVGREAKNTDIAHVQSGLVNTRKDFKEYSLLRLYSIFATTQWVKTVVLPVLYTRTGA